MKARKRALVTVFCLVLVGVLVTVGAVIVIGNSIDRSGWQTENGQYFYLNPKGERITGWLEAEDGSQYYFGADAAMVTGRQEIDGETYWFSAGGRMRTGWMEEDGTVRYLRADGTAATGWNEVDGADRYFLPDGALAMGWHSVDGERRYFTDDGTVASGWQMVDGSRYYFNSGTVATGWLRLEEGTYYLDGSGHCVTGLNQIDGKTYYFFQSDGMQHTGWLDLGENRYYFGEDGAAVSGWQDIDGTHSYFNEDGSVHRGWLQREEYTYYMLEDGTAATSPTMIDGQMCYFTPEGIYVLLVNYANPIPENYKVDLVRYGEWSRVASVAEQHLRQMILDCRATGIQCWLNCGFRTQDEQTTILEDRTKEYVEKRGMGWDEAEAEALKTVAVPGYSEHQTGLAMDIVCSVDPVWLHEHCWEYGFILRYPESKSDITHIDFEHWHYRYVGTEVSMAMKDTGLCLEEYLGAA